MPWYFYLAYFFAGAFLTNAIPHFVSGVCGRPFPTPFASPPGKGLSSPILNVVWGTLNLLAGYFLVAHIGDFHFRNIPDALAAMLGALCMALMSAHAFGRLPNQR